MHRISQHRPIHPLSRLIDREAQASADLLPLCRHTRRVLQRADLEHIRIVPALAQSRVGENHARRLIKGQQPLLILQDQIIRRDIVRQIRAAPETAVHRASRLLVNAEIPRVYLLYGYIVQIFHIRRIKNIAVFVHHRAVLLLEDPPVLPKHRISVCIILTVLRHLVDEEQRERLDPAREKPLLLLKMRDNRLTDLHPPEIRLRYIPLHISRMERCTVQEKHRPRSGIDVLYHIALVLRHSAREMAEIVPLRNNAQRAPHPTLLRHLELDPRTRRHLRREHNLREIEIAPRPRQILHLEPLHLDLLHQTRIVGIHRIQHIDEIVPLRVRCRIVQRKEGSELRERLLRHRALLPHLLRLIENEDRTVRRNHIDRTARAERIALRVDDARLLVPAAPLDRLLLIQRGSERLRVDDHHREPRIGRERIQLIQIRTAIDEEPRLSPVVLHEMLRRHLEGLTHALADRDARHHHDELAPAIAAIQLEHRLDVDIRLARPRLHLHIERTRAERCGERIRQMEIACALHTADIREQLRLRQMQLFIPKTIVRLRRKKGSIRIALLHRQQISLRRARPHIAQIRRACSIRLTLEHLHNGAYGLRLIRLHRKVKPHCSAPSYITDCSLNSRNFFMSKVLFGRCN